MALIGIGIAPKKHRRSSKQKHLEESEKNEKRKVRSAAVKSATTIISNTLELSPSNPNKKSQKQIVKEVNE